MRFTISRVDVMEGCDVVASVEAIFGDMRKRMQVGMEVEESASVEAFLFMMMDVFLELVWIWTRVHG